MTRLALTLLLAVGCARPGDIAAPYRAAHHSLTQELRLAHDFELDLLLVATLLTSPLVEAQAGYLSAARMELPADVADRLERAREQAAAEHVVVFAAYSPRDTAHAFAVDNSGDWQVQLSVDGAPQAPLSLEKIRRPDADLHALYPQLDRWSDLWVARFERGDEAGEVALTIAGVHGRGVLRWSDAAAPG